VAVSTFKPNAGKGQVGEQGLAFIFNAIQVNSKPGTVDVTLVEEVRDDDAICNLKITKFPAGWGKVEFWANPEIVSAGDSTSLNWHEPQNATYTIDYYIPQQGIVMDSTSPQLKDSRERFWNSYWTRLKPQRFSQKAGPPHHASITKIS